MLIDNIALLAEFGGDKVGVDALSSFLVLFTCYQ